MIVWALALSFVAALLASGAYLRLAQRWQLFDIPNHRSAHSQPIPRGGGVGLFAGVWLAFLYLLASGYAWPLQYLYVLLLATALVLVGVCDDRLGLPVRWRLLLYALAAAVAMWLLLAPAPLWLLALATLYSLWILNLFNFMDGIDGIAASEAVFVFAAAALLSIWSGTEGAYPLLCLLLAAASLGFLHWNWAPARLFMGDAGSIPLGFLLAALSVAGESGGGLPFVVWLILLAAFIADASYTLCWRAWQREPVTEAHSRHLYQRLARHWSSHGRVVQCLLAYNLLWLLPLAVLALQLPAWSPAALAAAYLPLLPVLFKAGKLP
ncbi:MAG: glycosyl transferase family 4 [Halieaceae bacterium]